VTVQEVISGLIPMDKVCIYYTDNQLDPVIMRACQKQLRKAFPGEIISVSLKPIDFGRNYVLGGVKRGIITMLKQIYYGLSMIDSQTVFLAEHDVLYHPTHFDFILPRTDTFYYNVNVWRWYYFKNYPAISYDFIRSLSGLVADKQLLRNHFSDRLELIYSKGWKQSSPEPKWSRVMGYEPGTKKRRRGGPTDEPSGMFYSKFPNIDIRHPGTLSPPKVTLNSFKHKPDPRTWRETDVNKIDGWENVEGMFI
jgi:hypothetical protein